MTNDTIEPKKSAAAIENSRELKFWQMIFLGKGTFTRQAIHAVISIALRLFFRRIETVNAETVPKSGALLFVLNHPNGLIDPGLVYVSLARRVSFLAKSTLFDIPVGGWLLRQLEILPVFRRVDAAGDMTKNLQTFQNCYDLLAQGRCIAIFPEGISHNEPKLQPLKTGAARIALGALAVQSPESEVSSSKSQVQSPKSEFQSLSQDEIPNSELTSESSELRIPHSAFRIRIVPVGLFYTSKTSFRSEALIRYGESFEVEPVALDENGEPPREAVYALTNRIETALRNVTLNAESTRELDAIVRAEALFSSVYENLIFKETLTATFARLQNLAKKYALLERNDPQKMIALGEKIAAYENDLKTSGVTAESLSVLQHPTRYVFRYFVLRVVVLLLFAPFAIFGAIIHSPAFVFSSLFGQMFKTHGADAAGSTYKILAAIILMPLTWIIASLAALYFFDWQIALLSIPLVIVCGYVALRSSEMLVDLSVWIKSAWLLFRQRALFLRLLVERQNLQKEIGNIAQENS